MNSPAWSIPPTSGSRKGPGSKPGISRPKAKKLPTSGSPRPNAALKDANVDAGSIDFIVLATSTPDNTFPATAATIQAALGMTRGFAFDVQAVCSGFVYAVNVADNFLRLGQGKRALVVGAEVFSRILDWEDRGTCVLFGDGAGAVVLEAQKVEDPMRERLHYRLDASLRRAPSGTSSMWMGGPSSTQTVGHLRMQGKEVFRFAVNAIAGSCWSRRCRLII